jgi:hypothetical protein
MSLAEFWYNSSFHSTLGKTPFEVLYGYAPRHLGLSAEMMGAEVPDLNEWLSERSLMQDLVRQHLLRAQARMKRQSNKYRSERSFAVGDWVFLKLQPYAQASVARRSSQKLAFRFFGPYKVEAKIGNVAYRLALPSSSQIHLVFRVSQLKNLMEMNQCRQNCHLLMFSFKCLKLSCNTGGHRVIIPSSRY